MALKEHASYHRDGRSPIPQKETISKIMSANKAKNTKPEILFRRALFKLGIRGYRLNWKKAPGRPDIAFPGRKLAIFINGCFWHRCEKCRPNSPKSNIEFWTSKFLKNIERDQLKTLQLKSLGWTVVTIWECEIKKSPATCVEMLRNYCNF